MCYNFDLSYDTVPALTPAPAPSGLIFGRLPAAPGWPVAKHGGAAGVPAAEIAAFRAALGDPRPAADRTLDSVVDLLLQELTW